MFIVGQPEKKNVTRLTAWVFGVQNGAARPVAKVEHHLVLGQVSHHEKGSEGPSPVVADARPSQ